MRLTWKEAVAMVFLAAIVVICVAFLNSTSAWLISSARGTAAAVLLLDSQVDDIEQSAIDTWWDDY